MTALADPADRAATEAEIRRLRETEAALNRSIRSAKSRAEREVLGRDAKANREEADRLALELERRHDG